MFLNKLVDFLGYVEPVQELPGFNLEFNDLLEPTAAR